MTLIDLDSLTEVITLVAEPAKQRTYQRLVGFACQLIPIDRRPIF